MGAPGGEQWRIEANGDERRRTEARPAGEQSRSASSEPHVSRHGPILKCGCGHVRGFLIIRVIRCACALGALSGLVTSKVILLSWLISAIRHIMLLSPEHRLAPRNYYKIPSPSPRTPPSSPTTHTTHTTHTTTPNYSKCPPTPPLNVPSLAAASLSM